MGLLSLLLVCCFLIFYFFAYAGNGKIVYVDSNKLLNGYKGMIEARKEYDKKRSAWQANIDTLTREVQGAIKSYSKDLAMGTQKEKELSKELISTKQKQLMDYQAAIKQNAAQEEQRSNQDVLNTVNTFLLKYGKQQGYKMILIAANGNIAYADPSMEITDKIIDELNKEYTPTIK
jgi:outer membrane protein